MKLILSAACTSLVLEKRRWTQTSAFFIALTGLILAGCANGGSVLMQTTQLVGKRLVKDTTPVGLPQHPDPRFRYLRVEIKDRTPAMWVLGYLDPHPLGTVEVWYSAQGEVLKLQNGRIVATRGLPVDWAAVRFFAAPPAWTDLDATAATFSRERDELPLYRYGLRERVVVRAVLPPPAVAMPTSVPSDVAVRYAWFEETVLQTDGVGVAAPSDLPVSRFAWGLHLGQPTVVYSEQCLGPGVCLRMQRWPVQEGDS